MAKAKKQYFIFRVIVGNAFLGRHRRGGDAIRR